MPVNNLYYILKPFIPRYLQIGIRRQIVRIKRKKFAHVWPIDPQAGKPPEGWTGWPENKKFALVLTHDVDTACGQRKCLQLIEMEKRLGFRSSFNFVPERYSVFSELRKHLVQEGFDVGVHGLKHDGKLYLSNNLFQKRAVRINHYLKEWNAVGFVSPSMHRNLDWNHMLNIQYDQSTFDTDPFEPQPDGVGTIFPFTVYNKSADDRASVLRGLPASQHAVPSTQQSPMPAPLNVRPVESGAYSTGTVPIQPGSYELPSSVSSSPSRFLASERPSFFIELPYTLPQDFTLFILMREQNINVWKQKLDWIAEKGGMALLNTHPDYMSFGEMKPCSDEYPAENYKHFLSYIETKYQSRYWHVLPRDVARFWVQLMKKSRT